VESSVGDELLNSSLEVKYKNGIPFQVNVVGLVGRRGDVLAMSIPSL